MKKEKLLLWRVENLSQRLLTNKFQRLGIFAAFLFVCGISYAAMGDPPAHANGSDKQLQYNNRGRFDGASGVTYSSATGLLSVSSASIAGYPTTSTITILSADDLTKSSASASYTAVSTFTVFTTSVSVAYTANSTFTVFTSSIAASYTAISTDALKISYSSAALSYLGISSTPANTPSLSSTQTWTGVNNLSSATITDLTANQFTSSGTWKLNAPTINGTKTDNSTTTYTGQNNFRGGISVSTGPTQSAMLNVGTSSVTIVGNVSGVANAAGTVGYVVSANIARANARGGASTVSVVVTTITLNPGTYDVSATPCYIGVSGTTSSMNYAINTGTGLNGTAFFGQTGGRTETELDGLAIGTGDACLSIGPTEFTVTNATGTQIFLIEKYVGTGTTNLYGSIRAVQK